MRNLPRATFWLIALGLIVLVGTNLINSTASKARAAL